MDISISDTPSPSASIFGLSAQYSGPAICVYDDTDPSGESMEYVDSIINDVKWLGFDCEDRLFYASDYYERLYQYALQLITEGKAYICSLSADEMREYRGTLTKPGKESPYRNRTLSGKPGFVPAYCGLESFEDGTHVLRAQNLIWRLPI